MTATPKKKRAKRGRPALPDFAVKDGARLHAAILRLGLSQAEAARRSDVRQGWLNDVVNGNRSLNREDLRKLAKGLNISADYLLGVRGATMFINETASAELAQSFAAHLEREVLAELERSPKTTIVPDAPLPRYTPSIFDRGDELLARVVVLAVEEARVILSNQRENSAISHAMVELTRARVDESDPKRRAELQAAWNRLLDALHSQQDRQATVRLLRSPFSDEERITWHGTDAEVADYRRRQAAADRMIADADDA